MEKKGLKPYVENTLVDILGATDAARHEQIKKEEKQCISIIVQSIHDSQLEYVKNKIRAKDMFDNLAAVFKRKSIAGKLLLRKQLLTTKMQESKNINDHFLNFDRKIRDLKSIGATMEEMDVICHLLLTLPKSYDNLRTAMETMNPRDLTLDFVKSRLLDEHGKRNINDSSSKSNEPLAMNTKNPNIICFKCGKQGHIKSRCKSKRTNKLQKASTNTNKTADNANNASSEKQEGYTLCAVTNEYEQAAYTCKTVSKQSNKDNAMQIKFVLDSGATEHMMNNKQYFEELTDMDEIEISVAKRNQKLVSKQHGNIMIKTFHNGDSKTRKMKNVLFVPGLKCNLLSIRNLTKRGFKVTFDEDLAYIKLNGKTEFVAHANGKLYEVTFQVERNIFAGISDKQSLNNVNQNLWHFRLGHLNAFDMKKMISHQMVNGMEQITVDTDTKFCEDCVYDKQAKSSFPRNKQTRSHRLLELIHTDVCGPMSQPAWDGSRYFVTDKTTLSTLQAL